MENFIIDGKEVIFFGKLLGSNSNKFNRITKIAQQYDEIQEKMLKIISKNESCTEDYSCAVAVKMMLRTGIRIGNEESAEGYYTVPRPNSDVESKFVKTYGLTTLLDRHMQIKDGKATFHFVGKKQVVNKFVTTGELVTYLEQIKACKGQTLFNINDSILTRFIKDKIKDYLVPKDFRTFRANVYAYEKIITLPPPTDEKHAKELRFEVGDFVCEKLNNTRSVVLTSYIDPMLFEHFLYDKLPKQ